jgi:Tol biopolymer transport system component
MPAGAANGLSMDPALSADGRFVAFWSFASNLVAADSNPASDVFVYDRVSRTTELVSVTGTGAPADGNSGFAGGGLSTGGPVALTPNGRFVAFVSDASNLVPHDTNGQVGADAESCPDVFVRDRARETTERINVSSGGEQARTQGFVSCSGQPSISADGRFVAFWSDAPNLVRGDRCADPPEAACGDVFLRDRKTGTTTRVSTGSGGRRPNGPSSEPAISANGRFIAFTSSASNLVAGRTAGKGGLFLRDRLTERTSRIPVGAAGSPSISATGRFVAFDSPAADLVPGDTNRAPDAFVYDRRTGRVERVSVGSGGRQVKAGGYSSAISADGRYVVFVSSGPDLVAGGTNICEQVEYNGAGAVRLRWRSPCSHVFVHDRVTGKTERVSVNGAGRPADQGVPATAPTRPGISANGRYVAFVSWSTNLIAGDTNKTGDIFLRDRSAEATTLVTRGR